MQPLRNQGAKGRNMGFKEGARSQKSEEKLLIPTPDASTKLDAKSSEL